MSLAAFAIADAPTSYEQPYCQIRAYQPQVQVQVQVQARAKAQSQARSHGSSQGELTNSSSVHPYSATSFSHQPILRHDGAPLYLHPYSLDLGSVFCLRAGHLSVLHDIKAPVQLQDGLAETAEATAADVTTSDVGITTSVTGNLSPETERMTKDELLFDLDECVSFFSLSLLFNSSDRSVSDINLCTFLSP